MKIKENYCLSKGKNRLEEVRWKDMESLGNKKAHCAKIQLKRGHGVHS